MMISKLSLPSVLDTQLGAVTIRRASADDLEAILTLMHDDPISAARGDRPEPGDEAGYRTALAEILKDVRNELIVAEGAAGVIATMQLTSIPGLSRRGSTRLLVEAVRVASTLRSSGVGSAMVRWITEKAAPAVGASIVQLTSDAARADAHRFYLRLGFVDSHVGFKYQIDLPRG